MSNKLSRDEYYRTVGDTYSRYQEEFDRVEDEKERANAYYAQLCMAVQKITVLQQQLFSVSRELLEAKDRYAALQATIDEAQDNSCSGPVCRSGDPEDVEGEAKEQFVEGEDFSTEEALSESEEPEIVYQLKLECTDTAGNCIDACLDVPFGLTGELLLQTPGGEVIQVKGRAY